MPLRSRVERYWRTHRSSTSTSATTKPHIHASDSQSTVHVSTRPSVWWWAFMYSKYACAWSGLLPLGIPIAPLLLLERPVGRVVVGLVDVERDRRGLVEIVEVPGLPGRQEYDEGEPREDKEGLEHPVGHHPARLVGLRLVVGERERRRCERRQRDEAERCEAAAHCWPGTSGGICFCDSGGSLSPRLFASAHAVSSICSYSARMPAAAFSSERLVPSPFTTISSP